MRLEDFILQGLHFFFVEHSSSGYFSPADKIFSPALAGLEPACTGPRPGLPHSGHSGGSRHRSPLSSLSGQALVTSQASGAVIWVICYNSDLICDTWHPANQRAPMDLLTNERGCCDTWRGTEADCETAVTVTCNDGQGLSNDSQMMLRHGAGDVTINTQPHPDKLCLSNGIKLGEVRWTGNNVILQSRGSPENIHRLTHQTSDNLTAVRRGTMSQVCGHVWFLDHGIILPLSASVPRPDRRQ